MQLHVPVCCLLLLGSSLPGLAQVTTLKVRHDHFFGGCRGELVFEADTMEYRTENTKHGRSWRYEDVQQFGVLDKTSLAVLTYEDVPLHLGKDRSFRFRLLEGEVSHDLLRSLEERLTRPLVSSVLPDAGEILYRIPVRHRKTLRGSEGVLEISDKYLVYRSDREPESRAWRFDELAYVGSTDVYSLRISAWERTHGQFGGTRNFVFDLKKKLEPEIFEFMWNRVNRLP